MHIAHVQMHKYKSTKNWDWHQPCMTIECNKRHQHLLGEQMQRDDCFNGFEDKARGDRLFFKVQITSSDGILKAKHLKGCLVPRVRFWSALSVFKGFSPVSWLGKRYFQGRWDTHPRSLLSRQSTWDQPKSCKKVSIQFVSLKKTANRKSLPNLPGTMTLTKVLNWCI